MKKIFFATLLTTIAVGFGFAEQLTTVAIVDSGKILTSFYTDSGPVREFEKLKASYQEELNKYAADLRKLSDQRVTLAAQGPSQELANLDKQIYNLQQFVIELKKLRTSQLQDEQKKLTQSDAFQAELLAAIKFVAESEGYSLVMDKDNPYLRWWSVDIDITDKVLDRLKKSVGK